MNIDTAGAVCVMVLATFVSSLYPIAAARLLFLVRFKYWLMVGGTMTRRACGKVTLLIVSIPDSPKDLEASVCPFPTDCIPALTISAMNAASVHHQSEQQGHQSTR